MILVVSGKAGAGKNFFSEHVAAIYRKVFGLRVAEIAFADPLKMVCTNIYGWDGTKGEAGRQLLQSVGTDIVQANNRMCWTNCIVEIIKGLESEFDLFIVTDARFPHEIDGIKTNFQTVDDVITLRVEGATTLAGDAAKHPSETALDKYEFDYIFNNTDHDVDTFFFNLVTMIMRMEGYNV